MKTLFHIQGEKTENTSGVLLLELGADHAGYAFFHPAANAISQLKYFAVDEFELETAVRFILEDVKALPFTTIFVGSAFPYALLTPLKYAKENSLLPVFYDQPGHQYFTDPIQEWQMVNAYSIPSTICDLLTANFPSVQFVHVYTPSIKNVNGFTADDQISIHFTTQHFRVLVKKGSNVLLAQSYSYKTPLDVVYYLLKICSELELSQTETLLVLSGWVEKESALYKELYTYFLQIHFAQAPSLPLPQHDYPQHFFSSFYNLATCVS